MNKIFYERSHLGKVQKAVKKLKELSKKKPAVIKQWLAKQVFWQVHLPLPKHVERPHYEVTIPEEVHQFALLYMSSDTLYRNKYKYIPSGTGIASRYKVARLMRTKQVKYVANMIADINKVALSPIPKHSSAIMAVSSKQSFLRCYRSTELR